MIPSTKIDLIAGVVLPLDYSNTLKFDNQNQQLNYFSDKIAMSFDKFQYIAISQSEGRIKIAVNIEYQPIQNVHYIHTLNKTGGIHCFYFVTKKNYISESVTEFEVKLDVFQTFQFSVVLKESFVERMHVDRWDSNHKPIWHYVDEGLDYGSEYLLENAYEVEHVGDTVFFLICASKNLEDSTDSNGSYFHHAPSPYTFYILPHNTVTNYNYYDTDGNKLHNLISFSKMLSDNAYIITCNFIPYLPFKFNVSEYSDGYMLTFSKTLSSVTVSSYNLLKLSNTLGNATQALATFDLTTDMNLPASFSKDNAMNYKYESKLLMYPYSYNLLTDWKSDPVVYKNEYFDNFGEQTLQITQNLSHFNKTIYSFEGYKNEVSSRTTAIVNQRVNDIPLLTDAYKNYILTRNASVVSGLGLSVAGGAIGGVASLVAGNYMGALSEGLSAFSSISQEIAKRQDLKNTPDTIRNAGNNINFDLAYDNTSLNIYRYTITEAYKNILASYWQMYGYRICSVTKPNITSRYYHNFLKGYINIDGNIDGSYIDEMEQAFQRGVNFWHYREGDVYFMNYSYDNVEVNLIG